jgi:hypothetical protein
MHPPGSLLLLLLQNFSYCMFRIIFGMCSSHGVTRELLGKFLRPATGRNNGSSVKEAIVRHICLKGTVSRKSWRDECMGH